jgi:hypothetical protein
MRRTFLSAGLAVAVTATFVGCANERETNGRANMAAQSTSIPDQASAITRATMLTRLDSFSGTVSAAKVTIADDTTPFLSKRIKGKLVWRVDFGPAALVLKSAAPRFRDRYQRTFSVFLDPGSGQLLCIRSRFTGAAGDMRPEPPAASAEAQMAAGGEEKYVDFPATDPKVAFLDAIDAILDRGIGSPLLAKEIDGIYVMQTSMGAPARAVWMITLRGIPPIPAFGPGANSVPAWQLNHMRNAVDANTGGVLFATSVPQPD